MRGFETIGACTQRNTNRLALGLRGDVDVLVPQDGDDLRVADVPGAVTVLDRELLLDDEGGGTLNLFELAAIETSQSQTPHPRRIIFRPPF